MEQLPAVYLEQDFLGRFLGALDDVLAPVLLTIDNSTAHLDPRSAPDDFLDWLAQWVAVRPHETDGVEQRRAAVRGAVARHRSRGTLHGLAEAVRLETGADPEITETGGTSWSGAPGSPLPGSPHARVTIRLRVPEPGHVDRVHLEELIVTEIPAHVAFDLEIIPAATPGGAP
jgi:phage tail-like protein